MDKILSIIIPVVKPSALFKELIYSFSNVIDGRLEIIIINQSGNTIDYLSSIEIDTIEHMSRIVPAANARNLGANLSHGQYIFFLDDDARVFSGMSSIIGLLDYLEQNSAEIIVAQRGEIDIQNHYLCHWPKAVSEISLVNFSRITIEWNIIINKQVFVEQGQFPEIGTGSQHAALSGEAFLLIARALGAHRHIILYPNLKISHPSLFCTPKSCINVAGYVYGAGYAVGLSINSISLIWKVHWIIRVFAATFLDAFFRKNERCKTTENINVIKFRIVLCKVRLYGFFDAVFRGKPREKLWLKNQVDRIS